MMSVASHGYKLLCKLYRKILGHQWVKRILEENPAVGRRPRALHLEPLEQRIMLDVSLAPGQWTYFDVSTSQPAWSDHPDAKDYFFLNDSHSDASITLIAADTGKSAPTQMWIRGDGKVYVATNAGGFNIVSRGATSINLDYNHTRVSSGANVTATGATGTLSATTYVPAGATLVTGGWGSSKTFGHTGSFYFDKTNGSTSWVTTLQGSINDRVSGADIGDIYAKYADATNFIIAPGSGDDVGDVHLASWGNSTTHVIVNEDMSSDPGWTGDTGLDQWSYDVPGTVEYDDMSANPGWTYGAPDWAYGAATGAGGNPSADADGTAGGGIVGTNLGGDYTDGAAGYSADMSSNPGWTYDAPDWAWGATTGAGGNPAADADGTAGGNVVGTNLGGDYTDGQTAYSVDMSSDPGWTYDAPDWAYGATTGVGGNPSADADAVVGGNVVGTNLSGNYTDDEAGYTADMSADPGWTYDAPDWEWGAATGAAGGPSTDADGNPGGNVLATNLGGNYTNSAVTEYVTSGPINNSGYTHTRLEFERWLGVSNKDKAFVEVSNDGGATWHSVYSTSSGVSDGAWTHVSYDISSWADDQADVRIRWGLTSNNDGTTSYGWYIDNVELTHSYTEYVATTVIDNFGNLGTQLEFDRWLGLESGDRAFIDVSNDGGATWSNVWSTTSGVDDARWLHQSYDISALADNQSHLMIRWGVTSENDDHTSYGWNIDNVELHAATEYVTTTTFDNSGNTNTHLEFERWLGLAAGDTAFIEVSGDNGATWTQVWSTSNAVADAAWTHQSVDISSIADNQSQVVIRWGLSSNHDGVTSYGWSIDNVELTHGLTEYAASGTIDNSGYTDTWLEFERWLGLSAGDTAFIEVSGDNGATWTQVWSTSNVVADATWTHQAVDISTWADNNNLVKIRWGLTSNDDGSTSYGWNIDNVQLTHGYTEYVTGTAIDASLLTQTHLSFERWLGLDAGDTAFIEVSGDNGVTWTQVWSTSAAAADGAWTHQSIDISAVADGRNQVKIRWGLTSNNDGATSYGWNIDNVRVHGVLGGDPLSGATGDFVIGYDLAPGADLDGNYADNIDHVIQTGNIDFSGRLGGRLTFQRWLGVDADDTAYIDVSVDGGTTWERLWDNANTTIDDRASGGWRAVSIPLPDEVSDKSQVRLRWGIQSNGDGVVSYGWNLDDVIIYGGGGGVVAHTLGDLIIDSPLRSDGGLASDAQDDMRSVHVDVDYIGDISIDGDVYASYVDVAYGDIPSVDIDGNFGVPVARIWAVRGSIGPVSIQGNFGDNAELLARNNITSVVIGDDNDDSSLTGDIRAGYRGAGDSDNGTTGTIDSVEIFGDYGGDGSTIIQAQRIGSLRVYTIGRHGGFLDNDMRIDGSVGDLYLDGSVANDLWIMGGLDSGVISGLVNGNLTIGGDPDQGSADTDDWNVGTLQVGDGSQGAIVGQLWIWGDVDTLLLNSAPADELTQNILAAAGSLPVNGPVFIDGTVTGSVTINGPVEPIHIGNLDNDADIIINGYIEDYGQNGSFYGQAGNNDLGYILIAGGMTIMDIEPAIFFGGNQAQREVDYEELTNQNLISFFNDALRIFSRVSLGEAVIRTGDHRVTDFTWDYAGGTNDFWTQDANAGGGSTPIYNIRPVGTNGFASADAMFASEMGSLDTTSHAGYGDNDYGNPTSDLDINRQVSWYGNYYYRGFRVHQNDNVAPGTTNPQGYSQESINFVDFIPSIYVYGPLLGTGSLPQINVDINQGRVKAIDVTPGSAQEPIGIESSTALLDTVHVAGDLAFIYVHGDESYRGDIRDLRVDDDIVGAYVETYRFRNYFQADLGPTNPYGDPITADPEHVNIVQTQVTAATLLGAYARHGAIGQDVPGGANFTGITVADDVLADIVADYGGIHLLNIGGQWGLADLASTGMMGGNVFARGAQGDIYRVRAGTVTASMAPDLTYEGGANLIAEGRIGVADDLSATGGAALDSDWAIYIDNDADWTTSIGGYMFGIEGSADGVRTRIHLDAYDVWNIDIRGNEGFGDDDRIDLPWDNDLYLRVDNDFDWDPNYRNDFTRDANGYPTVNHVLIGESHNTAQDQGLGTSGQPTWSMPVSDDAVARHFWVFKNTERKHHVYFFNEGYTDAALTTTYDGDANPIEYAEYVSVGGRAEVDQYIYEGKIDRIEFVSGPTGDNQGVGLLVTTKAYVPLGTAGFNFFGRVIGSGANVLFVASDSDIREVRVSNDNDILGAAFGLTNDADPTNEKGAGKRMGFISLAAADAADWDGDGLTTDRTAVISFNGFINEVSTSVSTSNLSGDVISSKDDINLVNVTGAVNSDFDLYSGNDIHDVFIAGGGSTITITAEGSIQNVQTGGNIDILTGGSEGVNTLINATGTIDEVHITHGDWNSGDQIVAGADSDLFITVRDVRGFQSDSTVRLNGLTYAGGTTRQYTLKNMGREGRARYYYVSGSYAASDRALTPAPYAEMVLNNVHNYDDQLDITYGFAGEDENSVLNTIVVDESSQAGFSPPGPHVTRKLSMEAGSQISALIVTSNPSNAEPVRLSNVSVGGSNIFITTADNTTIDWGGDGSFTAGPDVLLPSTPSDVALYDLNNDGYLDIVASSSAPDSFIAVGLWDSAAGAFGAATTYATDGTPSALAVGDVNGDGYADIVTANAANNSVSVLYNGRDGSFGTRNDYAVANAPVDVALGDVDKDGYLDIVTANSGAATVTVLLNDQDGTFDDDPADPSDVASYATASAPRGVVLGDVDRDGYLDIATANSASANVTVLLNDQDGTFDDDPADPNDVIHYAVPSAPNAAALGDVNNDGYLDLLTANSASANLTVRLWDESADTFGAATNYATPNTPQTIAFGHFNEDEYVDVAVGSGSQVTVMLNDGDADGDGFADGAFNDDAADPNDVVNYNVTSAPNALAVGDLGSPDGALDIVTANSGGANASVLNGDLAATNTYFTDVTLGDPDSTPQSWSITLSDAAGNIFPTDKGGYNSLWYRAGMTVATPYSNFEIPLNITFPNLSLNPQRQIDISASFGPYGATGAEKDGHLLSLGITNNGAAPSDTPQVILGGSQTDLSATTVQANIDLAQITSTDLDLAGINGGGLGGLNITGDMSGVITAPNFMGPITVTGELSSDLDTVEFRGDITVGSLTNDLIRASGDAALGIAGDMHNITIQNGGLVVGRIEAAGSIGDVSITGDVRQVPVIVGSDVNHDAIKILAGVAIGDITIVGDLISPIVNNTRLPIIEAKGTDSTTGLSIKSFTIDGDVNAPFDHFDGATVVVPTIRVAGDTGAFTVNGTHSVEMQIGAASTVTQNVSIDSVNAPNTTVSKMELVHLNAASGYQMNVSNGVTVGSVSDTLLIDGVVGGDISAGSVETLDVGGMTNQSVIRTTTGDLVQLYIRSGLTEADGRVEVAGALGAMTVEGSLTGPSAALGSLATPVVQAGGNMGVITVGSAAVNEAVGGRFVSTSGGTFDGFNLSNLDDAGDAIQSLRIEALLGTTGIVAPTGKDVADVTVIGHVTGPITGDTVGRVTIEGILAATIRSFVGGVGDIEVQSLYSNGIVQAATNLGTFHVTENLTDGQVTAGGNIAAVQIDGNATGGSIQAAGDITSIEIGGDMSAGLTGSSATSLSLVPITTTASDAPIHVTSSGGVFTPATNVSGPLIGMDRFRADPRFAGIDGSGYAVVVMDTGIDVDHPFFGPDNDGDGVDDRIVYQWDYAYNDADASDKDGHGSNVAGIVGSQDAQYTGMAPGVNLIALKVLDDTGSGSMAWLEQALQWVIAHADDYNIVSINMSLSDSGNYQTPQALYGIDDELAALVGMGVIPVAASGNFFYSFGSQTGVGYPAADVNALSVGAVFSQDMGGGSWGDGATAYSSGPDRITPFSQRDERLTTIMAPGARITNANATGGTVGLDGTSQAAPHIAGVAALAQQLAVQQMGRRLTVAEFTSLMRQSGVLVYDGDDEDDNVTNTGLSFPRVDMEALGEAILSYASNPSSSGLTISATGAIGSLTVHGNVAAGSISSGTDMGLIDLGSMTGGTIQGGGDIAGLTTQGSFSGGQVTAGSSATGGDIASITIGSHLSGGRIVAQVGTGNPGAIGALTVHGNLAAPFDASDPDQSPVVDASSTVGAVAIDGTALGWLRAAGGFNGGVSVSDDVTSLRLTGNVWLPGGGVVLNFGAGVTRMFVDGNLSGDINAVDSIQELIVTGDFNDNAPGNDLIEINTSVSYLYADTLSDNVSVNGSSLWLAGRVLTGSVALQTPPAGSFSSTLAIDRDSFLPTGTSLTLNYNAGAGGGAYHVYTVPVNVDVSGLAPDVDYGVDVLANFDEYTYSAAANPERGHLVGLSLTNVTAATVTLGAADYSATTITADFDLGGITTKDVVGGAGDILTGGLGGINITGDLTGQIQGLDSADNPQPIPFIGPNPLAGTISSSNVVNVTGDLAADLVAGAFTGNINLGTVSNSVIQATTGALQDVAIGGNLQTSHLVAATSIGDVSITGNVEQQVVGGAHDAVKIDAGSTIGAVSIGGDVISPFVAAGSRLPVIRANGVDTNGYSITSLTISGNVNAAVVDSASPTVQVTGHIGPITFDGPAGSQVSMAIASASGGALYIDSISAANATLVDMVVDNAGAGLTNAFNIKGSVTANAITSLVIDGAVGADVGGGSVTAGSITSLELGGLDNASLVETTTGDITSLTLHSSLTATDGRVVSAGAIGAMTVEGSLSGPLGNLAQATPVVQAAGDIGVITVGSAAAGETLGGRFVVNSGAGTLTGFSVANVESFSSMRIEGSLGATGLETATGVSLAGLTVTGDVTGRVSAADMPLPVEIQGSLSARLASSNSISAITVGSLQTTGAIQAVNDIVAVTVTNNLTAGVIRSTAGSVRAVTLQGDFTDGAIRSDTGNIGDIQVAGSMSGGVVQADVGDIGDVTIGGGVTGGRMSAGASMGSLTITGDLNAPYDASAGSTDQPVFDAAVSMNAVTIGGSATGWLRAAGAAPNGFLQGVHVTGDILDLRLDGNVYAGSPAIVTTGAIQSVTVTGNLTGDISAVSIQDLIILGDLTGTGGGAVTIDAPLGLLHVGGALPSGLNVGASSFFMVSANAPGAIVNLSSPDTLNPYSNSVVFNEDSFLEQGSGYNHFFFYRAHAPQPGDIEFYGTFQQPDRSDQANVAITIGQDDADEWIPTIINITPVAPNALLPLSITTNTDVGQMTIGGDAGVIAIDDGSTPPAIPPLNNSDGSIDSLIVNGSVDELYAGNVGHLQVDNGVGQSAIHSFGLVGGQVSLTWGGAEHLVAPAALSDPSGNGIPYDAVFTTQISLNGDPNQLTVVDLGGVDVYADVVMSNVDVLLNRGGAFYGSITSSTDVTLIVADGIGTGGYTAGPDEDVDFNNAAFANAVQGTFDDVLLNHLNVTGNLGAVVVYNNLYAEVNVTGALQQVVADGNIGGSFTVGGDLGAWAASGATTVANQYWEAAWGARPTQLRNVYELDGVRYSPDDAVGGLIAGGSIWGPITAGGNITLVKAGTNVGLQEDWITDQPLALSRDLISAGGAVNMIYAGQDLFARVNATTNLDYVIAGHNIESAQRKDTILQSGSATNLTGSGDPLINAAAIGFIGAKGEVAGAARVRVNDGSEFSWTDEAGGQFYLRPVGADATVVTAYSNVVAVQMARGQVFSTGDLGIVTSEGPVDVYTGVYRSSAEEDYYLPRIGDRSLYGLPDDAVITTGVTAGVLGVESLLGNVGRVASTGPVGSVAAHSGAIGAVDVIDNSLGLFVNGDEFTLATNTAGVDAATNVQLVRVLPSTMIDPRIQGGVWAGGVDSWLRGGIEADTDIWNVFVDHIGAGVDMTAVRHVYNVQVISGTGQIDAGLYWNQDRSQIVAQTGWVVNVLFGSASGNVVFATSDALVDVNAPAGGIQNVVVTGDLIGDIGSATTTGIGQVVSLTGSIGRQDLALQATPVIPNIRSAGAVNRIWADNSVFANVQVNDIGTLVANNGSVGVMGQADTIHIQATNSIGSLYATRGLGSDVTAGSIGGIVVYHGGQEENLTVNGLLNYFEIDDGDVNGTITAGSLGSLLLLGSDIVGPVNVTGYANVIYMTGSLRGAVTAGGIGILRADGAGGIQAAVTTTAGGGTNGDLGQLIALTGPISAGVNVAGNAGFVYAGAGTTAAGTVTVGGWLDHMQVVAGGLAGQVDVTGDVNVIDVTGGVTGQVIGRSNLGQLLSNGGDIAAPVTVTGHAGVIYTTGGVTAALTVGSAGVIRADGVVGVTAAITTNAGGGTNGDLGQLIVLNGPLAAAVDVARNAGFIYAGAGTTAAGTITVRGAYLGQMQVVNGGLAGAVNVTGDAWVIDVEQNVGAAVTTGGDLGQLISRTGAIAGAVNVTGNAGLIYAWTGVNANVTVGGRLDQLQVQNGGLAAVLNVTGDLGVVDLATGVTAAGGVVVGGDLGQLIARTGAIAGAVNVTGNAGLIYAWTGVNANVTVGGRLDQLQVQNGGLAAVLNVTGNVGLIDLFTGVAGAVTVGGDLGQLLARTGAITAAVHVVQNAGFIYAGAGSTAAGTVTVDGNLDTIRSDTGDLAGAVTAGGDIRQVIALLGLSGGVTVGAGGAGDLTVLYVQGNLTGDVDVSNGKLSVLQVTGNVTDANVTAQSMNQVYIVGVYLNTGVNPEIRATDATTTYILTIVGEGVTNHIVSNANGTWLWWGPAQPKASVR